MSIKSTSFLKRKVYTKHHFIEDISKDMYVIHYGCVDDDEKLIRHKFENGYYLHDIITRNSKKTIGIDLNKKEFSFLKKEFGIDNIVYGDVENPETFDLDNKILKDADVLLIPDLIEHLNNPGAMLDGIKKYFNKNIKVIILTPNPFAWYNFVATLLNKEIYTDYHTMYFTTESMSILLKRHGFKINKILPLVIPKQRSKFVKVLDIAASKIATFISPGFADAYMYECVLTTSSPAIHSGKNSN